MREIEVHPIKNGFVNKQTKYLVIGTFPPKGVYINNLFFFYYSSVKNHFWNRMENIFPKYRLKKTQTKCVDISEEQNVRDKKNFANKKKIGFLDVYTKISRVRISTKDEDLICIENIIDNKILENVLSENEHIKRICCTYKLAYEELKCKLERNKITIIEDTDSANGQKMHYNFKNRLIEIYLLYPATRSREKTLVKDEQYKKLLFT